LKEISVVRLGQCCGVTIDKKHQTYIRWGAIYATLYHVTNRHQRNKWERGETKRRFYSPAIRIGQQPKPHASHNLSVVKEIMSLQQKSANYILTSCSPGNIQKAKWIFHSVMWRKYSEDNSFLRREVLSRNWNCYRSKSREMSLKQGCPTWNYQGATLCLRHLHSCVIMYVCMYVCMYVLGMGQKIRPLHCDLQWSIV
jgi:hypothetical protein